jgi:hypothetical protein
MRKILVALLVFGLVVAFAAPASAVDIKVSGQYYVVGMYADNPSLTTEAYRNAFLSGTGANDKRASSAAWVSQRLRLQPEFKIAEGLTLTTRFDALEKKWGDGSWGQQNAVYGYDNTNRSVDRSVAINNYAITGDSIRTQENIEWERAYVDFNTAIGRFLVGYFDCICYGTLFLNTHVSRPGVEYMYPMGPWTFGAKWEHVAEGGSPGTGTLGTRLSYSIADLDIYSLNVDYRWKAGSAGLQFQYYADSFHDYDRGGYVRTIYAFNPFVKATFGGLYIEAEGWYGMGDWQDFRDSTQDVDLDAWAAYANLKYTMGPWYVGVLGAIETGDDPSSTDKKEGSVLGNAAGPFVMGQAWDPFLYMFNDLVWTGHGDFGTHGTKVNTFEDNCELFKIYIGWNITPKFRVEAGYGMAWADEAGAGVDDSYGSEFDLYAQYQIYSQLSYYVGFGYWWVGDFFKGVQGTATYGDTDDAYIIMHGLKLAF